MKKILALLFVIVLCFSAFAACDGSDETKESKENTTETVGAYDETTADNEITTQNVTLDNVPVVSETPAVEFPAPVNEVVLDNEFCKIEFKGMRKDDILGTVLDVTLLNKTTDKIITFTTEYLTVNGIQREAIFYTDVSAGKTSIAHKGLLYAAKVLAGTVSDLMCDQKLLENAKKEFLFAAADGYDCPISSDLIAGQ